MNKPSRARVLSGLDLVLGGLFLAAWSLVLTKRLGWDLIQPQGAALDLYRLYALAGVLGWASGNLFTWRSRSLPLGLRSSLGLFYFFGPIGLIFLAHGFGPAEQLAMAPLAPLFAVGVFSVFFLVPVFLRPRKS